MGNGTPNDLIRKLVSDAHWIERTTKGDLGIESEHAQFYLGNVYHMSVFTTGVAASANSDVLIKIPSTLTFIHMFSIYAEVSLSPCRMFLYEGTTVSANGTPQPVINKNRISANSAATTVFSAPTVTVLGTQVNFDYIPTSFKTGGVTDKFTYEDHIVLAPNMNYLFRLTNDSSSAIDIHQHIVFFESTSGLV